MNTPGAPDGPDRATYHAELRADARRIVAALDRGRADAPVAACPDWTVADLVTHLGQVHRWALHAVRAGSRPDGPREGRPDGTDLATWLLEGADLLVASLEEVPADAPSWNPFGAAPVAGFWSRRQALETMIHRWDVETAVGEPTPLPPELASDAIDEFLEVIVPRRLHQQQADPPTGSLHVHCTDVAGEWLVWVDEGTVRLRREHAKGDAALRGPAELLALHLWGRIEIRDPADVVGDPAVVATWAPR